MADPGSRLAWACEGALGGSADGDLLPVPGCGVETVPDKNLSRGTRQRVLGRRRRGLRVEAAVDSLNWLAGCRGGKPAQTHATHRELHSKLAAGVARMDSGRNLCTEGEARQALLRTSAGYELSTDNPNLAVYREGDVSLPDDVNDAPLIDTVLSAKTRRWLEEDVGEFVLSEEVVGAEEERRGPAGAYMDPVLANDPKNGPSWDIVKRTARCRQKRGNFGTLRQLPGEQDAVFLTSVTRT